MTAASRVRLENGTSSVKHSSISIANEYVSEGVVAEALLFSTSSGAEYLTTSPDDTVFEIECSLISSTIFVIPKSQICGTPLKSVVNLQLIGCERVIYLVGDKHVFLHISG